MFLYPLPKAQEVNIYETNGSNCDGDGMIPLELLIFQLTCILKTEDDKQNLMAFLHIKTYKFSSLFSITKKKNNHFVGY